MLDKCLAEFDELAERFMSSKSDEERSQVLEEAVTAAARLGSKGQEEAAETYIKLMQRVVERGNKFLVSEGDRVRNLLQGKLTPVKKEQLQARLNVLLSFAVPSRDEL